MNQPAPQPNVLQQSEALMRRLLEVVQEEIRARRATGEVAYNAVNNLLAALAIDMNADQAFAKENLGQAMEALRRATRRRG